MFTNQRPKCRTLEIGDHIQGLQNLGGVSFCVFEVNSIDKSVPSFSFNVLKPLVPEHFIGILKSDPYCTCN